MFGWFKRLFNVLGGFLTGQAAGQVATALTNIGKFMPYIVLAGDISTKYLIHPPGEFDDVAWAMLKEAFPVLFDGQPHTGEEVQAALLHAAAWMLQQKFPDLFTNTTAAVTAAQLAYSQFKYGKAE